MFAPLGTAPAVDHAEQQTLFGPADDQTIFPGSSPSGGSSPGTGAGEPGPESGPLGVGQVFGTRYHIIKLLGAGGMGAVYQAWDQELAVAVAIKVIRPEVMADPGAAAEIERRFKRELLLARQVTHKNVVRIHDLGEIDGIKYITMAYINGADLATVVKQQGRLPIDRVLRIARSVVSGLVAAHKAGVVHRDLKPANIMVDADDEALIMDFGIARSTTEPVAKRAVGEGAAPNVRLPRHKTNDATVVGSIVGTVEYMAPEQAKGLPVDQRADVYALGLILYDMLVGRRRAEESGSAFAELQARMQQPPPPARSIVPEIPEALDRLVTRCLDPDPETRFQTTVDLERELDRLDDHGKPIPIRRVFGIPVLSAVVVLAIGVLAAGWWYARSLVPAPKHEPVSVLIADFANGTSDPTFDHTLEPMLKLALEGAGFISAYDHSSVRRSLGVKPPETLDERNALEIAVKQGLGVVVSGSVARQGSDYALTMKAMQAVTGNVLGTARARASGKDDVLKTATKMAATIRRTLGDNASDSTQRFAMETLSATSLEAVRDYAIGQQAASNSRFDEARQSFSRAVDRDPKFGLAWAALAMASRNLD